MAHTQEPWFYGGHGYVMKNHKTNIEQLGMSFSADDSIRIAACVNACAEISTETLESAGKFPITKSSLNGYLHMKAQRNELLATLRDMVSDHESVSNDTLDFGRAVLAKMEV